MDESMRLPMGLVEKEQEASTAATAKNVPANSTDGRVMAYKNNAAYITLVFRIDGSGGGFGGWRDTGSFRHFQRQNHGCTMASHRVLPTARLPRVFHGPRDR